MKSFLIGLRKFSITLWIGGLWIIGYLVAPLLFSTLSDNRPLAGMLAGKMFKGIGWLSIACGVFLLIYQFVNFKTAVLKQTFFWLVLSMFSIALISQFWLYPFVAALKATGIPVAYMAGGPMKNFAFWHGVSSGLYLLQSLLGLVLILKNPK